MRANDRTWHIRADLLVAGLTLFAAIPLAPKVATLAPGKKFRNPNDSQEAKTDVFFARK